MINLIVKDGKTSPTNDGFLSCLAVAFTLLAMISISGEKTGACLNPAVAIAQTIMELC
jgi:glycerol uptake facilitator-like aquaporin